MSTRGLTSLLIALTLMLSLGVASEASARYFMTRSDAIHFARDYVHYKLGYHGSWAYCRPQWADDAKRGYVYHSWLCAWRGYSDSGSPMCRGLVVIKGSSDPGGYYHRRMWSAGDCPY